jgi:hypothetical protein
MIKIGRNKRVDNNKIFNPVTKICTWQNRLYETRKKIKRKTAGERS